MSVRLFGSHGRQVPLGGKLGRGGEGTVYEVSDRPDLVAKVYHTPASADRADKLRAMSALQTERLLKIAAWPVDTLTERVGGPVVGLLMPKIAGHKPIHLLYGPGSRVAEFPQATYAFLVHAAGNLSRAVAVVHAHGHVVGDINHDNFVVSQQATVRLIDCDSFQVNENGRRHLCDVGVSTHQPPEVLALPSFRGVVRAPDQDSFGLAVLVFQLLMMGRHPFAGRYVGRGEMPIERAIREHRYAYGAGAASRQMAPPPHCLQIEVLPDPISRLFERALLADGPEPARPGADEWVSALAAFGRSLRPCTGNPGHSFLASLPSCPLCLVEASANRHLFAVVPVTAAGPDHPQPTLDITVVWSEITKVMSPGPAPAVPSYRSLNVRASPEAVLSGRKRRARNAGAMLLMALGLIAWAVGVPPAGGAGFWSFAVLSLIAFCFIADRHNQRRAEARSRLDSARSAWKATERRWQLQAGEGAFEQRRQELERARKELEGLPSKHRDRLRELESTRRARELRQHLERHRLANARIDSIGPGREAALASYGIESASDVTFGAVSCIPGFGPVLTSKLLAWRQGVEASFRFNPSRGVDAKDVAVLNSEVAATQARLEQTIRSGASTLHAIVANAQRQRRDLKPEVDQALAALATAEAEWRAL